MTYVKLGEKAENFSDPISGFTIVGTQICLLTDGQEKSPKVKSAIKGGHLVLASKKEYLEYSVRAKADNLKSTVVKFDELKSLKDKVGILESQVSEKEGIIQELKVQLEDKKILEEEPESKFTKMTDAQLVEYYKNNFEVGPAEIKDFKSLPITQKIAELEELNA